MMRLLVKGSGTNGLAKHIADTTGAPLCGNHLKLTDWHIEQHTNPTGIICAQCRRISEAQAKLAPADQPQERSIEFGSP